MKGAKVRRALTKVWQCPFCGYVVPDIEFMSIVVNADCPDCRRTRFSEFNSRPSLSECKPRMSVETRAQWKTPAPWGGFYEDAKPSAKAALSAAFGKGGKP